MRPRVPVTHPARAGAEAATPLVHSVSKGYNRDDTINAVTYDMQIIHMHLQMKEGRCVLIVIVAAAANHVAIGAALCRPGYVRLRPCMRILAG